MSSDNSLTFQLRKVAEGIGGGLRKVAEGIGGRNRGAVKI